MTAIWSKFETSVPGKWVLSGEHAVLRGATAVAIPHPEYRLKMSFENSPDRPLAIEPPEATGVVRDLLQALADEWREEDRVFPMPEGRLRIESDVPVGAGLGSSAALCVALTRWLSDPLGVPESERFELARRLEHRFHGRSSGMDIAVVLAGKPISFSLEKGAQVLPIRSLPRFTFHDTGLRARTSECVVRVEQFREERPTLAMQLDEAMSSASRLAMEGLFRYDAGAKTEGIDLVAQGMMKARECFYSWQVVPGEGKRLEDKLLAEGAKAVKMTGAGGGGMVVALWADEALRAGTS